jgi:hypothetical protein
MLGIEGAQKVQVIKQPDVLMLLYLLDHHYDEKVLRANWDYYAHRTDLTYGSSLGPAIQSILAARVGDMTKRTTVHAGAGTDLEDTREMRPRISCSYTWRPLAACVFVSAVRSPLRTGRLPPLRRLETLLFGISYRANV